MSGSSGVPSTPPPPPLPGKSDLARDVDETIKLFCEALEGATKPFPEILSKAAATEVRSFCAEVTRRADRYTGDFQAVALSRWELISEETKKELAELAKKAASPYQAPPRDGRTDDVPDVSTFTNGRGKQFKLSIPVKFASHTDVKLLVNTDMDRLLHLDPKLYGVGAEVTQPWRVGPVRGTATGSVLVDTKSGPANPTWFIRVDVFLP